MRVTSPADFESVVGEQYACQLAVTKVGATVSFQCDSCTQMICGRAAGCRFCRVRTLGDRGFEV